MVIIYMLLGTAVVLFIAMQLHSPMLFMFLVYVALPTEGFLILLWLAVRIVRHAWRG